jgi:hypothetical protein
MRGEGEGRNGALDSARPRAAAERLVSGVPAALSTGGAAGLPDLPREGRGLGVVSRGGVEREDAEGARLRVVPELGGRGMGRNMGRGAGAGNC